MSEEQTKLDSNQTLIGAYDESNRSYRVIITQFAPSDYDQIVLAYIETGDGAGQIGMIVYKKDSVTIGATTIAYDSEDRISTVSKV